MQLFENSICWKMWSAGQHGVAARDKEVHNLFFPPYQKQGYGHWFAQEYAFDHQRIQRLSSRLQ